MNKIKIAGIKENDIVDGDGICVSVWVQGCPHRCPGCHNPETWEFNGGKEYNQEEMIKYILNLIGKNGIQRNLSLLGGEPFCKQNEEFCRKLAAAAHEKYPTCTIFCWTGYTFKELNKMYNLDILLKDIDILIDGRYIDSQRDITLKWRGSPNQQIRYQGLDY